MARPLEPAFDAPPVDLDERRLHLRAHRNWTALLRGRAFPAPGEFGIEALGNLAAYAVEIDLGAEEGAMLRGIGGRLRDDPPAQLGRDQLGTHRNDFAGAPSGETAAGACLTSATLTWRQRKSRLRLTSPFSMGVWSTRRAATRWFTASSPSPWRCHWP